MRFVVSLFLVFAMVPAMPAAADDSMPDWWFTYALGPTTPDEPMLVALWVWDDLCTGAPATSVDVLLDGQLLERVAVPALEPCRDKVVFTESHTIAAGLHTFTLAIDPDDLVAEADETNNVQTFQKRFTFERPDLDITVDAVETSWLARSLRIDYTLCNIGNATYEDTADLHGFLNGRGFDFDTYTMIPPASCVSSSLHGTLDLNVARAGYSYILDIWESGPRVNQESDYSNNDERGTFDVGPADELPPLPVTPPFI